MGKDQDLWEAARKGDIAVVEKILSQRAKRSGPLASLRRGPGANAQDSCGYTALHHAALNGHKDVVEMLLTHEASCNVMDSKGSTPLHLAAWTGNQDVVSLLLCHGPSVPDVNLVTRAKESPLHAAAQYGHTAVLGLLLEHGCDPGIRNEREETALDLAAQYGRLEAVECLVRTHPELVRPYANTTTVFQITPLHLASRNGHRAVVDLLLDAGVDVNVRTTSGSALHEAALHGKLDVVRALLEAGVDLRVRDSNSKTVVDLLRDFPSGMSAEIDALIRRHRARSGDTSDGEDLGPMGGRSPRSPYDNASPRGATSPIGILGGGHHDGCSPRGSPSNYQSSAMSIASESSFGRDLDQMSLSSVASSTSNRRGENVYLAMGGRSPGAANRISPTPPKKPPRRNLSVSPTHLSADSPYEFLCLARSGSPARGGHGGASSLRRGKSADQYVEMRLVNIDGSSTLSSAPGTPSGSVGSTAPEQASPYEEVTIRSINPRRKLRRVHDSPRGPGGRSYENCEPTAIPVLVTVRRDSMDVSPIAAAMALPAPAISRMPLRELPLSPTHYQQPPTPDHPPPSAQAAERSIHERIRPLSQEYQATHKRSSRDMETETDDDLLVCAVWDGPAGSLSGSVCSSISMHSDALVEEYIGDQPFAGLLRGSTAQVAAHRNNGTHHLQQQHHNLDQHQQQHVPAERPKTLRRLKHVYDVPLIRSEGRANRESSTRGTSKETREARELSELHETRARLLAATNNHQSAANSTGSNHHATNGTATPASTAAPPTATPASAPTTPQEKDRILSPFDEQEEWNKISEIMASLGSGLVRDPLFNELEREFQERLGVSRSPSCGGQLARSSAVGRWLDTLGLGNLEQTFLQSGYDDLDFMAGVLEDQDLQDMGVSSEQDRQALLEAAQALPCVVKEVAAQQHHKDADSQNAAPATNPVDEWLRKIRLEQYCPTFAKNMYSDMARVRRMWEVEMTALLEITKVGHRRRMLQSVSGGRRQLRTGSLNPDASGSSLSLASAPTTPAGAAPSSIAAGASTPSSTPASSAQQQVHVPATAVLSSNPTGTLRHSKKSRPAPQPPQPPQHDLTCRDPSELLEGVPGALTTTWRHRAHDLVNGTVTYLANYLGSTVVKELRGTESTKKSIQKLKAASKDPPQIVLSMSYRGVQFLEPGSQQLVCEHEVRNIHCACQDSDDLTHFAYITKDHLSNQHFCHVFYVPSMDQATEVIMTLGQAFEVAYQMALRERAPAAPTRSMSISGAPESAASPSKASSNGVSAGANGATSSHVRSKSCGEHPAPRLVLAEDV